MRRKTATSRSKMKNVRKWNVCQRNATEALNIHRSFVNIFSQAPDLKIKKLSKFKKSLPGSAWLCERNLQEPLLHVDQTDPTLSWKTEKRKKWFASCSVNLQHRRPTSFVFHLHSVNHSYYQERGAGGKEITFISLNAMLLCAIFPLLSQAIAARDAADKATGRRRRQTTRKIS